MIAVGRQAVGGFKFFREGMVLFYFFNYCYGRSWDYLWDMNVPFFFLILYESRKESQEIIYLRSFWVSRKNIKNWSLPQEKKYKEINFTIWFFCSLYLSLAFLAVKIILLFFNLVGVRRPTHRSGCPTSLVCCCGLQSLYKYFWVRLSLF